MTGPARRRGGPARGFGPAAERTEQRRLQRRCELADLVEEERAPVGQLEEALLVLRRPGEGAPGMAEQQRLETEAARLDQQAQLIEHQQTTILVTLASALSLLVLFIGLAGIVVTHAVGAGALSVAEHAVALMAEQLVGLLDVVELEAVRDHRAQVDTSGLDHRHQPAHASVSTRARRRESRRAQ